MITVDPNRAIFAAVIMVAIGITIFIVRNKRMSGHRMGQNYE